MMHLPLRHARRAGRLSGVLTSLLLTLACQTPLVAQTPAPPTLRIATYNAALSGPTVDHLPARLARRDDPKLCQIAQIIQRVRPDVLLINEFDHDPNGHLAAAFQTHYLNQPQADCEPIHYTVAYSPPVNTGQPTGLDLDGDGQPNGPGDAHGWGRFPGQYGMLLLSNLPAAAPPNDTQRHTLWASRPDPLMPLDHYPPQAKDVLRLSSKTHARVPLDWQGQTLHILISHPTPPVFDGPENRNGRRNRDEIALIVHLLDQTPGPCVVLGDLNADPHDGDAIPGAIGPLLQHPRLQDPAPTSTGATLQAEADGGANRHHQTPTAQDTCDWHDFGPNASGNLRVDYVLPTRDFTVVNAGVFWPAPDQPGHDLITASDHRLVWVDLKQGE